MSIIEIWHVDEPEKIFNSWDCTKTDISNVTKDNQLYIYLLKKYSDYFSEWHFEFIDEKDIWLDIKWIDIIYREPENWYQTFIDVKTQLNIFKGHKLVLHARDFLPNKSADREFVFFNTTYIKNKEWTYEKFIFGPIILISSIWTQELESTWIIQSFRQDLSNILQFFNNKKVQSKRLIWQKNIENQPMYQEFKRKYKNLKFNVDGIDVLISFKDEEHYRDNWYSPFYMNINLDILI